jgi:MFS family permease
MPDHDDSSGRPVNVRPAISPRRERGSAWLNRNVVGMGLTSFLSDFGHEMATAVLPAFLASIGAGPAVLGFIEGIADAVSSFVKVWAGHASDRWGHRKAIAVMGYALTGISKASFALATTWHLVLLGRVVGWFGRGIRGPVRDAMLAESVQPAARGRAFGFHRASDTTGAVAGPLLALLALRLIGMRAIFVLTLIPGLLSALAFAVLVHDPSPQRRGHPLLISLQSLPAAFRRFLVAVGLFGIADCAPTLLVLRAQRDLEPAYGLAVAASTGVALYLLRNALYASASYPIGSLSDRIDRRALLAAGYGLAALTFAGFAWLRLTIPIAAVLFALAGIFIAAEDTLEGALAADLLHEDGRGLGFGILATVNGVGDLVSSAAVGALWSVFGAAVGFTYAAAVSLLAAVALLLLLPSRRPATEG